MHWLLQMLLDYPRFGNGVDPPKKNANSEHVVILDLNLTFKSKSIRSLNVTGYQHLL